MPRAGWDVYGYNASQAPPANNIAGPSSIGLSTSVKGTASNVSGALALLVLGGGLIVLYFSTKNIQGILK